MGKKYEMKRNETMDTYKNTWKELARNEQSQKTIPIMNENNRKQVAHTQ